MGLQWQDAAAGLGEAPPGAHEAAGDEHTKSCWHVATVAAICPMVRIGRRHVGRDPVLPCLVLPPPTPRKSKWAASDSSSGCSQSSRAWLPSQGGFWHLQHLLCRRKIWKEKTGDKRALCPRACLKGPLRAPGDTAPGKMLARDGPLRAQDAVPCQNSRRVFPSGNALRGGWIHPTALAALSHLQQEFRCAETLL